MPIITYSKSERIPLHIPPPPPPVTEAQQRWPVLKAQWLAAQHILGRMSAALPGADQQAWQDAQETLTDLCAQMNTLLQPPPAAPEDETAVFYFHRLLPDERERLKAATTERGETNWLLFWQLAAQEGTDGWDVGPALVDPDLQPVPVPIAATQEEQRRLIAQLVYCFPPSVQQQLGVAAIGENPSFLLSAWQRLYHANSSSVIDVPATNIPAGIVAPSMLKKQSDPPATVED